MIAKPGSVKTYKKFEAEIYVLTKDEGGRHTAFFSNYRPQIYLRTADVTGKVELLGDVKMVMPGDNVNAAFELISPLPLQQGIFQLTSSSLKEKCTSQLLTVLPIFMHLLSEIICLSSLYFYNEIYILVQGICDHLYAFMHHTHCKIHKHLI